MEDKDFRHKDELINEALKEFAYKGFSSASLNQIIKRAGISKGSFYHHFHNKEELLNTVFHRAAQEKLAFVEAWIQGQEPLEGRQNFFDMLRLRMAGGIEFGMQNPELSAFLLSIMKNSEIRAKVLALSHQYYEQIFDALVEEAWQRGELRHDLDSAVIKKLLKVSLVNAWEIMLNDSGELLNQAELEKNTRQYVAFLQSGLGGSFHEQIKS